MNLFLQKCDTYPDTDRRRIVYGFYMMFSTLHLPVDGSGRWIGDVDTFMQMCISDRFRDAGRVFEPHLISVNGYRIIHDEEWYITEEMIFRYHLLSNISEEMGETTAGNISSAAFSTLHSLKDAE